MLESYDGSAPKNSNIATCKDRPSGGLVMLKDSLKKDDTSNKKWVELKDCSGEADEVPLNKTPNGGTPTNATWATCKPKSKLI
mgnify:CR=1 FL=1